jgi:hypothetical protein
MLSYLQPQLWRGRVFIAICELMTVRRGLHTIVGAIVPDG